MSKKAASDTYFTLQVKGLLDKIYGRSRLKDSVLDRACSYFENLSYLQLNKSKYKEEHAELNAELKDCSAKKVSGIKQRITVLERQQRDSKERQKFEQEERSKHLLSVCREIIELSEGEDFAETNRKSAQILGTIQLLSVTEGKRIAEKNEQHKPLYRVVLCLRLLDALCIEQNITEPYIRKYLEGISAEEYQVFAQKHPEQYQEFVDCVKIPVVMAALLQDIGNYHPDAQTILAGTNGQQDPFRTLDVDERKELLQINYRETYRYLADGIGMETYVGNSKLDRDLFIAKEKKKLLFLKYLHKNSVNPKNGTGNLLKVPQIYASIILSTKHSYNYKLLPKVFQALNQNAERGACSPVVVDTLYRIVGVYPQGYGVTYIPDDNEGNPSDRYEYAIVTQLYPENPEHPICRMATRQLTFISHGQDIVIENRSNLYLVETAKKLSNISKERLSEILELLASNYREREKLDLIPRCWHTSEFFSLKENQKLWNKTA